LAAGVILRGGRYVIGQFGSFLREVLINKTPYWIGRYLRIFQVSQMARKSYLQYTCNIIKMVGGLAASKVMGIKEFKFLYLHPLDASPKAR